MHVRTMLAAVGAGGLIAAGLIVGTGGAEAVTTDGPATVRQVLCADGGDLLDVSYINATGNTTSTTGRMRGEGRQCRYFDTTTGEYGGLIATSIIAENGGYAYCSIWVDGVKVAESEDSSGGGIAFCA
ncbi:membrane protein [Gordonia phage NHagos]|nr:membrane protein [Gordonia phage NHagos]